ncbi:MAG: SOS response-associated peptidase family protein [Aquabacterium sp.]
MCNLYHMTPQGEAERYLGRIGVDLEAYTATTVGPYQAGLFVRPEKTPDTTRLVGRLGQWGMIQPGAESRRPAARAILTNNARIEDIRQRITYRGAWRKAQRCLILAAWYQEPNWETGKNIWWQMKRADGQPWALAGLWSEWTDPHTGELVANYTMITCNCDGHSLLARLHKPDPTLPPDKQDKRAVAHINRADWDTWLHGTEAEAAALIRPTPAEQFDLGDAQRTDALLREQAARREQVAAARQRPIVTDRKAEPPDAQGSLF